MSIIDAVFVAILSFVVKTRLIDWLENKIGEKGVEVDSGDGRIGKDGYKAFVETQRLFSCT